MRSNVKPTYHLSTGLFFWRWKLKTVSLNSTVAAFLRPQSYLHEPRVDKRQRKKKRGGGGENISKGKDFRCVLYFDVQTEVPTNSQKGPLSLSQDNDFGRRDPRDSTVTLLEYSSFVYCKQICSTFIQIEPGATFESISLINLLIETKLAVRK